jgi:hypothetical protein
MKKILLPVALLLCCCYTHGQIQTITSKKVPDHVKYDSLKNYLGLNVYAYMGQELYLRPVAESLRKYGYMSFYTQPIDDPAHYKTNTYKCCDSYNAAYDSLQGKYFTVVAITRHPQAAENEYLYGKKYFFKLVEKVSRDTSIMSMTPR